LKNLFRLSVLSVVAINVAQTVFGMHMVTPMFLVAVAALISGFPQMSRSFRRASVIFLVLGLLLLAWRRHPLSVWLQSAGSMTNIIAIVTVMQIFTVPIKSGGYDTAIKVWMQGRFRKRSSLFLLTTLTTHILTSFLNMGAVPVMVSLFGPTLEHRYTDWKRFFSQATTRGYVLAALWAPGAINIYLIVQATGLSWSKVFIPGILIATLGIGLSMLMESRTPDNQNPSAIELSDDTDDKPATRNESGKVIQVIAVAIVFVVVVALMDQFGIGASSGRSVLAGALIALGWTLVLSGKPGVPEAFTEYWREGTLKVADIAPFFVAMGVFSTGIEGSGFLELAGPVLQSISQFLGPASVILIAFLIVVTSLVGLHPFITIVLFGKILAYTNLSISPLTVALSLSAGSITAYMVTPFAGVIMAIARSIGVRTIDVAFNWNWRFCSIFFVITIVFAFLWGAWFG